MPSGSQTMANLSTGGAYLSHTTVGGCFALLLLTTTEGVAAGAGVMRGRWRGGMEGWRRPPWNETGGRIESRGLVVFSGARGCKHRPRAYT